MGFGHAIQERINQLRAAGADVPKILRQAQKDATFIAIEKAVELTPKGPTGDLRASWSTDSITEPRVSANVYTTTLASNLQHASYVNDGHEMVSEAAAMRDKSGNIKFIDGKMVRWVPGEWAGETGERFDYIKGHHTGMLVKEQRIPEIEMKQAAETAYRAALEEILIQEVKGIFAK